MSCVSHQLFSVSHCAVAPFLTSFASCIISYTDIPCPRPPSIHLCRSAISHIVRPCTTYSHSASFLPRSRSAIRQVILLLTHESLEVRIAAGCVTALLFAAVYRHSGGGDPDDSTASPPPVKPSRTSSSSCLNWRRTRRGRWRAPSGASSATTFGVSSPPYARKR